MATNYSIYKGIKTVFNKVISVAPWGTTDSTLDPTAPLGEDGQSNLVTFDDWKTLSRCKQASEDVATESDPEDAFDELTHTRVKNENLMVSTRSVTYDMERQTILYTAIYNGIADPMSSSTLEAISSGKGVKINETNNPKVKVAMKEETYNDTNKLLFTKYSYGYLIATGTQTADGKISRPQIKFELEPSPHNQLVYAAGFLEQASEV